MAENIEVKTSNLFIQYKKMENAREHVKLQKFTSIPYVFVRSKTGTAPLVTRTPGAVVMRPGALTLRYRRSHEPLYIHIDVHISTCSLHYSATIGRACGIARNFAAASIMRQPETSPLRSRLDEIRTAVGLLRR